MRPKNPWLLTKKVLIKFQNQKNHFEIKRTCVRSDQVIGTN